MESMGQSRTSEVQRDARIGEAECNRQDKIKKPPGEKLERKLGKPSATGKTNFG